MKELSKKLLPVCLAIFVVSLLAGCVSQEPTEYIHIKKGPPPEIIAEGEKAKMLPAGYMKRRLRLGYPSLENIIINDRQYIFITEKWFNDVIDWTEKFIAQQVPRLAQKKQYPVAYPETFVELASNIANISVARRYNLRASVAMGMVTAKNEQAWGEIPGDGSFRVYLFGMTENYSVIYDVYTGQSIKAGDFPNLDSITGIMF